MIKKLLKRFKSKQKTKKLPTLFLEQKKIKKTRKRITPNSKKIFTKNAPINLVGKLTQISRWAWLATIIATIIGTSYVVFFTQIFNIQKVIIFEDNEESTNVQIRRLTESLRNSNIFLFNKNDLSNSINQRVENLTQLHIKRQLPNTVLIYYNKYQEVANVANLIGAAYVKKNFILNEIGYLVDEDKISTTLPTIFIKSDKAYTLGNKIITHNDLEYTLDSKEYFEDKFDLQITEIHFLPKAKEVRLLTERNFQVWLDINIPFKEQLNKLKNAIPKIDIYNGHLEYIDLRIQNADGQKIIYK